MRKDFVDVDTGEVLPVDLDPPVRVVRSVRENGSVSVGLDFTGCPSMAEPHHARETDINYLVAKYKPDELALYLASRDATRALRFHDFTLEPDIQGSMNIVYRLKKFFEGLPEDTKAYFGDTLGFLKFADNPQNTSILQKMGLLKSQNITEQSQSKNQNQNQNLTVNAQSKSSSSTSEAPAPQGAT